MNKIWKIRKTFNKERHHEQTNYSSPITLPEGSPGGVIVEQIIADNDGNLWVYEQSGYHVFDLPEGFDSINDSVHNYETIHGGYTLRKLVP